MPSARREGGVTAAFQRTFLQRKKVLFAQLVDQAIRKCYIGRPDKAVGLETGAFATEMDAANGTRCAAHPGSQRILQEVCALVRQQDAPYL